MIEFEIIGKLQNTKELKARAESCRKQESAGSKKRQV